MNKSVLIMATPGNCINCRLCRMQNHNGYNDYICTPMGRITPMAIGTDKPDWCPLRPLPEKKKYGKKELYDYGCVNGWNDAIQAIEGSGE